MRDKVATAACNCADDKGRPRLLIMLLSLLSRCENRLLMATLNIASALFAFEPAAIHALHLRAWDILAERLNEVMMDVSCGQVNEDASLGSTAFSEVTLDEFSGVKPSRVMGRIIETLALISAAGSEAPLVIFDAEKKQDLPKSLTKSPSHSGPKTMRDLLYFADTILLKCGDRVDVQSGINVLTIVYNLSLYPAARRALSSDDNNIDVMLEVLKAYLPGNTMQRLTAVDQLDLATLIMGVFCRISTSLTGAMEETGDSGSLLLYLLESNLVFAIQAISRECDEKAHEDLIVFLLTMLTAFSESDACREIFYTTDVVTSAISALIFLLNSSFCSREGSGLATSIRALELVKIIHAKSHQPLASDIIGFLVSYRSLSAHSKECAVIDCLDALFVVAEVEADGKK